MTETFAAQADVRGPWRRFIDDITPLRPDLFKYCCGLTGSLWEGEDLAQDVLLHVFGQLGKLNTDVEHPRAYLIRMATNLWFDRLRRLNLERAYAATSLAEPPHDSADIGQESDVRAAANRMFLNLAPRERAAVMLVDVLDFTLAEAAELLKATIGSVKSALHRGRDRLKTAPEVAPPTSATPRALIDRFVAALSARDFEAIRAMCLASVTIEMVGGATFDGYEAGKSTFEFAHFIMPDWGFGESPRWSAAFIEGEPVAVGFRTLGGVEGVNEVWRFEMDEGGLSKVRLYCFNPEVIAEVAAALGAPALDRPYRSPP